MEVRERVESRLFQVPGSLLTPCAWMPRFVGTTREDLIQYTISLYETHSKCYVMNKAKLDYMRKLGEQGVK